LNIASENAQHLTALIEDLLAMSQLDAGKYSLQKEVVVLADVVGEVVNAHQRQADDLHISLHARIADEGVMVEADPLRMIQVLNNLVENALKFTPARGEIRVSTSVMDDTEALITVQDTGAGIPSDQLEMVFDKFYQVNSPLNEIRPGVGLGLAICQSLIELHGGRIWAESDPQRGTQIHFTLPLIGQGAEDAGH